MFHNNSEGKDDSRRFIVLSITKIIGHSQEPGTGWLRPLLRRLFETLLICLNSDLGLVLNAESTIVESLDKWGMSFHKKKNWSFLCLALDNLLTEPYQKPTSLKSVPILGTVGNILPLIDLDFYTYFSKIMVLRDNPEYKQYSSI